MRDAARRRADPARRRRGGHDQRGRRIGSLITFPTLVAFGYPPVLANVSNNIGLVPAGVASAWGYRRELADQGRRLLVLGSMSVVGGVVGAVLLLVLPSSTFKAVVPILLAIAIVLVVA
jgi:uncharacterized membrane protein YfcA